MLNEAIDCITDGYPEPVLQWKCSGGAWFAIGSSLFCTEPGQYTCTCSAYNLIEDVAQLRVWKGIISISDPNIANTTAPTSKGTLCFSLSMK